jgi:methionyl-tRNA synthetase
VDKKRFFISTSIPYVNAAPHLGHALEFVQADVVARFRRLQGEEVFFLSGTDDNALKNVQAAEKAGKDVVSYVEENTRRFIDIEKALNISNDDFIKTASDPRHFRGAQKLWRACKPEDIYKKTYRGFYCVGCEEFKTEKDLVNGECPEHPGKKLEEVEEENYFFKLSNYQQKLEELISNDTIKIIPESRKNETLAFIKGGLEDFSISRSKERARGWGVPVPGDESQIMYVWFDALSNYINALGYADESENYKKFWVGGSGRVHAIGKGINRFHTIYWPAMLLSAGVPLPTAVFIHGYITVDGQKMSKSIGNVIDPNELIKKYGIDGARFQLIKNIHPYEDTDITWERLEEWYKSKLSDGIGNITARIMALAAKYIQPIDISHISVDWNTPSDYRVDQWFNERVFIPIEKLDREIDSFIQDKIDKNSDEGQKKISGFVTGLYEIGLHLQPFMPETSKKILEAIKENKKPENLFPRKD